MNGIRLGVASVVLALATVGPARAQHEHMLIGSTASGGGSLVLAYDFTRPTVVDPPTFTGIDPSFAPQLFDDPSIPIYALAAGVAVRIVIVSLDAGASVTVNGTKLDTPGEGKKIGNAPDLHNHVTWALTVPSGTVGDFALSFKLTAGRLYADSPVYTITITNRPADTTTTSTTSVTTSTSTTSTTVAPGESTTTTSVTTSTSTTSTTVAPGETIDAQLCYRASLAKGSPRFDRVEVTLVDRFGTANVDVKNVWAACNPVLLGGDPLVHPAVGFERMTIRGGTDAHASATPSEMVTDAFGGSYALDIRAAQGLMVPGGMASAGMAALVPPDAVSGAPGAVHHLACYRAKSPRREPAPPPPPVLLDDRFGSVMLELVKPRALCVPVNAGGDPVAESAPGALVCWQARVARGTPKPARTLDERASVRFGAHHLAVKSIAELCVPAGIAP